jgi:hypothetical protein
MRRMIGRRIQRIRRTAQEIRFRIRCWWLTQQVEFLVWQLGTQR